MLGLVLTQDGVHPGVDLSAVAEALPDEVEDRALSHLVDARNLSTPHDLASREPDSGDELDHDHRSQGQRSPRSQAAREPREPIRSQHRDAQHSSPHDSPGEAEIAHPGDVPEELDG